MARHKKLIQKYIGFPLFHTNTNAFTFPLTHGFLKDFSGLDTPSLDLQFATDKTLTARKGPTPTFTRASGATQVGSTGLIEYAPENLVLHSENFKNTTSGSYWSNITATSVTVDQTASPTGAIDADLLATSSTSFDSFTRRAVSWVANATYSYSIFIKRGPSNYRYVAFYHGVNSSSAGGPATYFDFDNPTVVNIPAGQVGTIDSTSVEPHANGWYRIKITFTTAASPSGPYWGVYISNSLGVTINGVAGLDAYIWGIQVERHPSVRAYIPTTTAAVYGARFDHDPVTLASKGLLIEESRTNLQTNSQTFAGWSTTDLTVAASVINDPMGQLARTLTEGSAAASSHRVFQDISVTNGTTYSASYYVKAGTRTWCGIVGQGAAFTASAYFNLSTGALGSGSGAGYVNHFIQPLLNGWYRVTLVATAQATGTASLSLRLTTGDNTPTYNGDGVSFLYASMGQTEAGSFPTSYIPTTTTSVIRSADVCSITGGDFTSLYNATEGTLLLSADEFRRGISYSSFLRITNSANTGANRYSIGANGSKTGVSTPLEFIVGSNNIVQYKVTPNSATSNYKAALAYKVDDMGGALNGTLTTADVPPSALIIGANSINIGAVGIHIAAVRYYRKRLSNAKLQAITT